MTTLRHNLPSYFEGDDASERIPKQVVGPFRLRVPNCCHVISGHVLYTSVIGILSVQASRQESVHWLVFAKVESQVMKLNYIAAKSGNHVDRETCPFSL